MSMRFSRQEYWSGLSFPFPRDLPDTGIKPRSPALQADSLPTEPPSRSDHSLGRGLFAVNSQTLNALMVLLTIPLQGIFLRVSQTKSNRIYHVFYQDV